MAINEKKVIQYLTILELIDEQEITAEQVRSIYRKLTVIYHPDTAPARYKDGKKFNLLVEAKDYVLENLAEVNGYLRQMYAETHLEEIMNNLVDKIEAIDSKWSSLLKDDSKHQDMLSAIQMVQSVATVNTEIRNSPIDTKSIESFRFTLFVIARKYLVQYSNEYTALNISWELMKQLRASFNDLEKAKESLDKDEVALSEMLKTFYSGEQSVNTPIVNASNESPTDENTAESSGGGLIAMLLLLACIVVVFVFMSETKYSRESRTTPTSQVTVTASPKVTSRPTPRPTATPRLKFDLPDNGHIFVDNRKNATTPSFISIDATGSKQSALIKVKDTDGTVIVSFFVRAGHLTKIPLPAGKYNVYFAQGDEWYGYANHFGDDTYYSKDDEVFDANRYTMSYTLYSVENGNFTDTPISKDEF